MKATALVAVVIAVVSSACGRGDREVRLRRLELQRQALTAQLDALQARLLVDRGRVAFWAEMKVRRDGVSAVACGATDQAEPLAAARPHPAARKPPIRPGSGRLAALERPGERPDPTP